MLVGENQSNRIAVIDFNLLKERRAINTTTYVHTITMLMDVLSFLSVRPNKPKHFLGTQDYCTCAHIRLAFLIVTFDCGTVELLPAIQTFVSELLSPAAFSFWRSNNFCPLRDMQGQSICQIC